MFPICIQPAYQQQQQQMPLHEYLQLHTLLASYEQDIQLKYKKQKELSQRRIDKEKLRLQAMYEFYCQREKEETALQAYLSVRKEQEEKLVRQRLIQQQNLLRQQYIRQRQQQEQHLLELRMQQQRELEEQRRLHLLAQQQRFEKPTEANPFDILALALSAAVNPVQNHENEEIETDSETDSDVEAGASNAQVETEEPATIPKEQNTNPNPEAGQEYTAPTVMSLDDFVQYIQKKAQSLDEDIKEADNKEEQDEDITELAIACIDDSEDAMEEFQDKNKDADAPCQSDSGSCTEKDVSEVPEFAQFPKEDPIKIAKYEALSDIERELNEIRQKHEDHILHVALDFSTQSFDQDMLAAPSSILTATTAENREFLSHEDRIMKLLLKLDMISSDGDENIRNERKAIVKQAEIMLERLDEFKQKEWERVSAGSHSSNDDF